MNKQEAIEKIEKLEGLTIKDKDFKNVIGWEKVYYRSWNRDGALVIDFGSHRNFFYVER